MAVLDGARGRRRMGGRTPRMASGQNIRLDTNTMARIRRFQVNTSLLICATRRREEDLMRLEFEETKTALGHG